MPSSTARRLGDGDMPTPTRTSGPTPNPRSQSAIWLACAFSSAYVTLSPSSSAATACGVRATCCSKSSCAHVSGSSSAVSFHSRSSRRRSSSVNTDTCNRRCEASAATLASNTPRFLSIRRIVARSNNAVMKAKSSRSPSARTAATRVRSNFEDSGSDSAGTRENPTPPASTAAESSASTYSSAAWKIGARPGSRAILSASTSFANGRSWWP